MENTENKEFEFSFTAIFKMFKGKLKALVAVVLASAILGGAFSVFVLIFSKRFYGNLLTFYLPISESTGYNSILPLLESDIFLQKILIDTTEESYTGIDVATGKPLTDASGSPITDENGQPLTTVIRVPNLPFTTEQKENYKKYTFLKQQSQNTIIELKRYFNDIPYEKSMLKENLDRKRSDYSTTASLLSTYLDVQAGAIAEATLEKMKALEAQLDILAEERKIAEEAYSACISQYQTNELKYHNELVGLNTYKEELEKIIMPLYTEWKTDPKNSENISLAEKGVEYSFSKVELFANEEDNPEELEEEKNPSRKFLHIKIRINNDEELAQRIITNIHNELPDFISTHSTPSNWLETIKTTCVSVPTSNTIFESSILITIAKYVIVFTIIGTGAFVCVVVAINLKKKYFPVEATPSIKDATDEPKGDDKDPDENN